MSDLAWTGQVLMTRADWGDENGSTVTFKLPMIDNAEDKRNPFHSFTKRRKGKAGTRFMMACQTAGEDVRHVLYEDEAMLAGWNDSQQNGHTAKFWLCNDGMGHPFEGISRSQKLVVSLVELDDDNEIIDQKVRDRVEKQSTYASSRPSYGAVMLCKNETFHAYLKEVAGGDDWTEDDAKVWMCNRLGIESRAELNHSEELRVRYHAEIWLPFDSWGGQPF